MPFHKLFVQLTFATENRAPWIKVEVEDRLYQVVRERCAELECKSVAVGGMPDHLHLLVELSPAQSISTLAKDIQVNSTAVMARVLGDKVPFQWQEDFGALTLRAEEVEAVARYIENQKELHVLGKLSKVLERST
ncbi:MAG: IS200/IS605 family transposase [Myxococcales bacterium]